MNVLLLPDLYCKFKTHIPNLIDLSNLMPLSCFKFNISKMKFSFLLQIASHHFFSLVKGNKIHPKTEVRENSHTLLPPSHPHIQFNVKLCPLWLCTIFWFILLLSSLLIPLLAKPQSIVGLLPWPLNCFLQWLSNTFFAGK